MKTVFFKLIICLVILSTAESCSIFGIEKIIIRRSEFTYSDDDILLKGKLYSIKIKNDENIVFPILYKVPAARTMDRPNIMKSSYERTVEYQPTISFLTKGRFILNMGCTIYGKMSKNQSNSFDIDYIENSNDCNAEKFSSRENMVVKALNASNKCVIEKDVISFKR